MPDHDDETRPKSVDNTKHLREGNVPQANAPPPRKNASPSNLDANASPSSSIQSPDQSLAAASSDISTNTPPRRAASEPKQKPPKPVVERNATDGGSKSKGKRKAEEEVEALPPDPKKDIQRATFVIPPRRKFYFVCSPVKSAKIP
jgi:hypothetical protein